MDSGPIRVLHVDDDLEFAELAAARLLRECDRFDVETVANAADGMDRLAEADYDCVVSDYDMPRTDGLAFLEEVRAEYPDLPFILFTGEGSEGIASEAISAGVTDYLRKIGGTEQYELLANRIRNAVGRYHSERALRDRLRQLELTLEKTTSVIWEYDPATGNITWYEGSRELWQFDSRTTVPMADAIEAHVHPDDRADVRDALETAVSGDDAYRVEFRRVTPDGYRWVEARGEFVCDGDGEADPGRLIAFTTDISERKERTEELELYETMLETVPDGVYALDDDFRYTAVNQGMTDLLGYSREELIGSHVSRVVDENVMAKARRQRRQLAEGGVDGTVMTAEHDHLTADGETVPIEVRYRALPPDEDGSFCGTAGVLRDISERRQREQELERAERIIRAMNDGVVVVEGGTITYTNPQVTELVGYPADELAGEPMGQFIAPEYRETVRRRFEERIAGENPPATYEIEVVSEDDERIPVEITVAQVVHDDRPATVSIVRDITERKRRERELERQNERLEEFASVVSHDLRNPLNVAEGNLELAREDHDSDHFDAAARALDRMDALLEDLLTLAREGKSVEGPEPVGLADLVDACWHNVETADATLVVDTELTIRADRSRLQQLVENLVDNAIEHGGDGVTVTVGDLADGSGFFVADDGPGIPEDDRDEVFERGYSTAETGTGFGLAIVEGIAEAHGWEIRVTDSDEGGARFEITGVESVA